MYLTQINIQGYKFFVKPHKKFVFIICRFTYIPTQNIYKVIYFLIRNKNIHIYLHRNNVYMQHSYHICNKNFFHFSKIRFILSWKDVAVAIAIILKANWLEIVWCIRFPESAEECVLGKLDKVLISSDEKWFWNMDNQNKFIFIFHHLFDFLKLIVKIE